jgi:hypothetical protein
MGECLLFSKRSSGTSGCAWRHMGRFVEYDHGRRPSTKKYYPEPHRPSVSLLCKWIFGRMRETKITNTELNWLYSALIAKWPIDPSYLMINRWCCEATSGSGDICSGCYLSMLAISLKPGITRNPNHLLPGTSLGIWRKGNLNEDERGGFKVAKVNLPLSDGRLRLWLEEGLLVPAKKNKREGL